MPNLRVILPPLFLLFASAMYAPAPAQNNSVAPSLNYYLIEAKFTDQSWEAMARKPQDRAKLLGSVVARLGGRVANYWFSFGDYDAVVVVELPNDTSAEALQIAGLAGGGFKTLKTTSLLTTAQAQEAMKKAGELRGSSPYKAAHDALTPKQK